MLLNISKTDNGCRIHYNEKKSYLTYYNEIESELDKPINEIIKKKDNDPKEKKILHYLLSKDFRKEHDKKIRITAHNTYCNNGEYTLNKLLSNLKAVNKIYGDYLILDYFFKGIYLCDEKGEHIGHCIIDSGDEELNTEFNCHLLGEPFSKFVKECSYQQNITMTNGMKIHNMVVCKLDIDLIKSQPIKKQRKRTYIPRGLRKEVFMRDNYTCKECGATKEDGATLHIDHIIPVSKGGTDTLDNLQTLCSHCNLNKSNIIQ